MNCNGMSKMFDNTAEFKSFAEYDKEVTLQSKGTGIYQCFCERKNTLTII